MASTSEAVDDLARTDPDGREPGLVIYTYPKTIFLLPTFVVAVVCGLGMLALGDRHEDHRGSAPVAAANGPGRPPGVPASSTSERGPIGPRNVLALGFLVVFALNLLMMSVDFPRFTVLVVVLLAITLLFFALWLGVYFDLMPPLVGLLERVTAAANAQFYLLVAASMLAIFGIVHATRRLDYWVIRPNEILHNHGPFSDLERYPTFNLKFDKEIPDILAYIMLRAGRIVLQVAGDRKTIVLDNVLWIGTKEERLKGMMSRLNVRVTTDREVGEV